MIVGQRWITRGGAVVEVTEIRDTGLMAYTADWKPLRRYKLVVCRFVQYAGGESAGEPPSQFAVHDDGLYLSDMDHALDLVRMVERVAA